MGHRIFTLIFISLIQRQTRAENNIQERTSKIEATTSIVVPCHHKHAKYLYDLITIYTQQTSLPNEVVIALSGTTHIAQNVIDQITHNDWPFRIRMILSRQPKSEGANRNIACKYATENIIIGQDADDLPHPQRIEIVKYFFQKYSIFHLVHAGGGQNTPLYSSFDTLRHQFCPSIDYIYSQSLDVLNGAACMLKKVPQSIKYREAHRIGCDIAFNNQACKKYGGTLLIKENLYTYRRRLSAYRKSF